MKRLRRPRSPFPRLVAWWNGLAALDRVMYRACALFAAGFVLAGLYPLALIVPGVLFALAYFGFGFRRAA